MVGAMSIGGYFAVQTFGVGGTIGYGITASRTALGMSLMNRNKGDGIDNEE